MTQPAPLFSKIDESTAAKLKERFSGKQVAQDPQKLQHTCLYYDLQSHKKLLGIAVCGLLFQLLLVTHICVAIVVTLLCSKVMNDYIVDPSIATAAIPPDKLATAKNSMD